MTSPRVAVVGGGAAGLAAACRLLSFGVETVLFEAAPETGGVIRSTIRDGWLTEAGPNLAAEPDPEVRALLDAAGVGEQTIRADPASRKRYVLFRGELVPVPTSTGDLVASPLLSLGGRLRLLKEPFVATKRGEVDETVDAFARRRFGDEVAERMFDPLVRGTSGGDSTAVAVKHAFPNLTRYEAQAGSVLKGAMRSRMEARRRNRGKTLGPWSCRRGMGDVPRHLTAVLGAGLRCNTRVEGIETRAGRFLLQGVPSDDALWDGVVLAVPAREFSRLRLAIPGGAEAVQFSTIPHASVAVVSLGFRRADVSHPLDGSGFLVPSSERSPLLATVFASTSFPSRAPANHVLLTAIVGGSGHLDVTSLSEHQLQVLVQEALRPLLGVASQPIHTAVTVWRDAIPQLVIGHEVHTARAAAIEAAALGLSFAGAWHDGLPVSEVLRGGVRAADRVIGRLTPAPARSPG